MAAMISGAPGPDRTSYDDAASGPNPRPIASPLHQGTTAPITQDALDSLLLMPHRLLDVAREIGDLRNVLVTAFGPKLYANSNPISNLAGTQLGSLTQAYILAFAPASHGAAVLLRNIMVGTSAAGVVQLYALAADQLWTDKLGRLLGTVRTTSSQLTVAYAGEPILLPDERLFALYVTSQTVNMDFSCDYRILRAQ